MSEEAGFWKSIDPWVPSPLRRRIGVTLLVLLGWQVLQTVPLINVDLGVVRGLLGIVRVSDEPRSPVPFLLMAIGPISLGGLGVRPLMAALLIAAIAARAFPGFGRRLEARGGLPALERWAIRASVPIAVLLGWAMLRWLGNGGTDGLFRDDGVFTLYLTNLLAYAAAAALTGWFALQLGRQGLGSGVVLLAAWGLVLAISETAVDVPRLLRHRTLNAGWLGIELCVAFAICAATAFVCPLTRAVQVRKSDPGPQPEFVRLPLCPNAAWVFLAAPFLADVPRSLAKALRMDSLAEALGGTGFVWLSANLLCTFLISFLWLGWTIDPKRIARELAARGAGVADVAPGRETEEFLSRSALRGALVGTTALFVIGSLGTVAMYLVLRSSTFRKPVNAWTLLILTAAVMEGIAVARQSRACAKAPEIPVATDVTEAPSSDAGVAG
ncbi:MAG: hypothetical protein HYY18_17520 [Planctomycetes bacterium]|nr:hypothetical protein [Planctomycetota bacterium]